jgi:microcompartment protein CcmK/EutM
MQLGRVVGSVWATAKDASLTAHKFLIVQPVSAQLQPVGRQLICLDAVGAGTDELIYWCRGKESSFPFRPAEVPADATIVGIVDEVSLG